MNRFLLLFTFLSTFLFSAKAQTVIHSETFTTGTITWTAFDEAGTTDKWATTAGYAQINGFQDEDDIDWLISPTINMNNATNETFAFKTKNRFSGVATGPAPNFNLELKYTTNYTGNPTTTTWTTLTLPSTFYLKSDGTSNNNTSSTISAQTVHLPFDISAISGTNVRFAFRYYGTAAASKDWQIDDIEIAGATPCIAPTTQTTH